MRSGFRSGGVALAAVALVLAGVGIANATGGAPDDPRHPVKAAAPTGRRAAVVVAGNESTFVAITPCRVVDTRVAGGKVGPSGRSFYLAGMLNFRSQGGTSGGCGIPASATAVAANVVAVQPSAPGFLRAYPAGAAAPSASILNYQTAALANALTLAVRSGSAPGLTISSSASAHVVIDVTGYYAPQIDAYVYSNGQSIRSGRVISVTIPSSGVYTLNIDSDVTNCAAQVTTNGTTSTRTPSRRALRCWSGRGRSTARLNRWPRAPTSTSR